jgi:hypothetical protein
VVARSYWEGLEAFLLGLVLLLPKIDG